MTLSSTSMLIIWGVFLALLILLHAEFEHAPGATRVVQQFKRWIETGYPSPRSSTRWCLKPVSRPRSITQLPAIRLTFHRNRLDKTG